jgi:hypothetical protein
MSIPATAPTFAHGSHPRFVASLQRSAGQRVRSLTWNSDRASQIELWWGPIVTVQPGDRVRYFQADGFMAVEAVEGQEQDNA